MGPTTDSDLLALQGNIKRDPESYEQEFALQFRHYKACLDVFNLKPSEDSRRFAELVLFLAQVSACYPDATKNFVPEIVALLEKHYAVLNSSLRQTLVKALIMVRNKNQISALELLPVFFTLFRCQDKTLRRLIFKHIIADVKQANKRGQNQQFNRAVQNYFYAVLEDAHDGAAKQSLAVLIELWQRQVWRDARTANVIASAALHKSTKLMLAALKFFLGQDEKDPDDSDDEDDDTPKLVNPSKADVYKATKKGTTSSKRKKEAKLKRVMAAVKRQQRKSTKNFDNFAAIQLLHDPQKFAEELFKRLNKSQGEKFETKMAMMSVISRVIGVHKLLILNFYPFMQKYVLPHQRDAPKILAILVQAVHDEVPPDALQPVLRQLVDQFVHDRARPEVMTLGLKSVRSLCERAPLVISPELLQDLVMYKKIREKEVASAARSLITLFRELAPGMLEKKDRGRDADLTAGPKAFGAEAPLERVPGADLLQQAELTGDLDSDCEDDMSKDEAANSSGAKSCDSQSAADNLATQSRDSDGNEANEMDLDEVDIEEVNSEDVDEDSEDELGTEEGAQADGSDKEDAVTDSEAEPMEADEGDLEKEEDLYEGQESDVDSEAPDLAEPHEIELKKSKKPTAKRKRTADAESLSSMKKRLAEANAATKAIGEAKEAAPPGETIPLEYQRILTEEDFERIRELRHKKMVSSLMQKHGLKSAAKKERLLAAAEDEADEALNAQDMRAAIREERIAPDALIGRHKTRQSKEERLAKVMEGREGRSFGAAASRKHKKVGGKSNKEKLKHKNLPQGAKKHIVHRRASKQRVGSKNFKGHTKHLR